MTKSKNITQKMLGGARRKNGHKTTCNCHICENMRSKAKRGGYEDDYEKIVTGGSTKKNGHKANCKCPICKNMSKKMRKGGSEVPNENITDEVNLDELYEDEPEPEPQANNVTPRDNAIPYNMIYNGLEDGNVNPEEELPRGGSHRCRRSHRRSRRRKGRKGGDGEPDIENQKGDLEEEGIRSTMDQPGEVEEETDGDNYDEIDELDKAELGESGVNKVGGTRRRKRSHRRKTRRNKKHSRRHRY
jgi:hypothetical protein